MSGKNSIISIENVSFTYPPPNRVQALKNVSLSIGNGEFVALIGQNGSGKTTLAKCISGFLKPTKGVVRINGRDTKDMKTSDLAKEDGYIFQNPDHQLFKESKYDEIAFGSRNIGTPKQEIEKKVRDVLERMHLWEFRNLHPFRLSMGCNLCINLPASLVAPPHLSSERSQEMRGSDVYTLHLTRQVTVLIQIVVDI